MTTEESIRQSLVSRFPQIGETISIQRARRLSAAVDAGSFADVFRHAITELGFTILCTITGLDEGETYGVIYHLARADGTVLNLRLRIPAASPVVPSVLEHFPGAELYERELVDMLGITVTGLPSGSRYPLPDDWPAGNYPLRKGWNASMLNPPQEEPHG